jgi:hypothetical protein
MLSKFNFPAIGKMMANWRFNADANMPSLRDFDALHVGSYALCAWRRLTQALNPNSQPSSFNNHRISLSLALSICPR